MATASPPTCGHPSPTATRTVTPTSKYPARPTRQPTPIGNPSAPTTPTWARPPHPLDESGSTTTSPARPGSKPRHLRPLGDPLTIDGRNTALAGNLTWAPAPPLLPWLGLALLIALVATLALWSPVWRAATAAFAATGTLALIVDSIGFATKTNDNLSNKAWAFVYPLVALLATVRLAVHARRRTPEPTLAMMIAGLVLTFIGGVDRFDVVTSVFYDSALDVTIARVITFACLGIGAALIARFRRFLIPYLKRAPTTSDVAGAPATQLTQDTGLERRVRRATK